MNLALSMAAFALAASISPGPVNVVALASGVRHGLRASLGHAAGATFGFCVLLLLVGNGLHQLLGHWGPLQGVLQAGGVLFLLYMALRLASDDGALGAGHACAPPSAWCGATMQWLNPRRGLPPWPGWAPTRLASNRRCGSLPGYTHRYASCLWPAGLGQAAWRASTCRARGRCAW